MNPMDTAPRDGTRFMAKWPDNGDAPEEWLETWWWDSFGDEGAWLSDEYIEEVGGIYAPTEWRPL